MTHEGLAVWSATAPDEEYRMCLALAGIGLLDAEADGYEAIESVTLEIAIIRWRHAVDSATQWERIGRDSAAE